MTERAALPAVVPNATPEEQRELVERAKQQRGGEQLERRRQMRGLLVLALVVIVLSIARAGVGRVFPHGWWRVW